MADLFADHAAYPLLASQLQSLAQRAGPGQGLRAWVAGCGTGEDAYTVAVLLNQICTPLKAPAAITVFATETDPERLAVARAGVYPASRLARLPRAQRERFFFPNGGEYHVKASLREQVIFAAHHLLGDPPFSRLKLVLCHELFGGLSASQREEALGRFAFALLPGGLLLLGEPLPGELGERYFRRVAPDLRLYARTDAPMQAGVPVPPAAELAYDEERRPSGHKRAETEGETPHPTLIVDRRLQILNLAAGVERFLRLVPGTPSYDLLAVIQPQLRATVAATISRAQARRHAAESLPVPVTIAGLPQHISVVAQPLSPRPPGDGELMVCFVVVEPAGSPPAVERQRPDDDLPLQLATLRAQHDVVYEELRVANEELQISNQELQALAEELETRREELQTLNEQLKGANREQQRTLADLLQTNADLENLIGSTAIGTLFLDRALRLQRYTPPVEQLFNLLPTDLGRPLAHLTHQLQYPGLLDDTALVLAERRPVEREVSHQDGRWFLARLRPYYSVGRQVTGVVLAFLDISERREATEALRRSHDELERRVAERTAELMEANAARQTLLGELVTAQEAERLRIARELHDTIGQQITAILLGFQAVKEQSFGRAGTLGRLEEVAEIVQAMGREMHAIAVALRPTALDDVGLAGALRGYVEVWSRRTGIAAELFVSGVEPKGVPPEVETTIYRVVQEALTNVARHAGASRVSVVLESDGRRVVAVVEDEGRGFDVEATNEASQRQGHLGLLGMQERVALVRGTLTIESEPGTGATVIARIPVLWKQAGPGGREQGSARR